MYLTLVFLPLLGSIFSGFFGRFLTPKGACFITTFGIGSACFGAGGGAGWGVGASSGRGASGLGGVCWGWPGTRERIDISFCRKQFRTRIKQMILEAVCHIKL